MVDSLHLGEIIKETGGLGRFQIYIVIFMEICSLGHSWSVLFMSFGAAVPDYFCDDGVNGSVTMENTTDECFLADGIKCSTWTFSRNMRTVVSEFSLVCDRKSFTQTITTVQMSGMLVGAFLWGHICDAIGRKYTLFLGLGILSVSNLIIIFSVNWEMFAALRFMIGLGALGINTSTVLFEFIRNKWRFWLGAIPIYSVITGLMALFCWKVTDWRYICVTASVGSALPFLGWKLIPESYRWLVARGRFEEAEMVIKRMAHTNRRPVPDLDKIRQRMKEDRDFIEYQRSLRIYTVIDLFRTRKLFKMTTLFSFIWLAGMFSYFGIQFDVPQLSGNLYLNMFLLAVADVPGSLTVALLNIKFGRKWSSFILDTIAGVLCAVVGILQKMGSERYHAIIIGLVITAKFTANAGWIATAVWTLESYPTVIRHIGRGLVDCLSRIGAVLAPQIITLSLGIPGLLYFVSSGLLVFSGLACVFLEETKNQDLEDILPSKHKKADEKFTEMSAVKA